MSQKNQNHTEKLQISYHTEDFLSIYGPILNLRMREKLYTGFISSSFCIEDGIFNWGQQEKARRSTV